jgi:hypothetical protein
MVTVDRTYALPVYLQTCRILASGGFHSTEDHVNMRLVWTRCKVLFKTIIKHASAIFRMKNNVSTRPVPVSTNTGTAFRGLCLGQQD